MFRKYYLDFHTVENLAVVDSNNRSNHLREDDHVTQVCFNDGGLLELGRLLLGATKLLEQGHVLPLQSAAETTTNSRVHHLQKLVPVDEIE